MNVQPTTNGNQNTPVYQIMNKMKDKATSKYLIISKRKRISTTDAAAMKIGIHADKTE